jgi:hypothetical protein
MARKKSNKPKSIAISDTSSIKSNQPFRMTRNVKIAPRPDDSAYSSMNPWWAYSGTMLASSVFAACRQYKAQWGLNYIDLVNNALRYADRQYSSFYGQSPYVKTVANQKLSLNVTASCIDTLVSKIGKNIPSISYLTNGGDYHLQMEAELLEKFMQGWFQFKKMDRLTPLILKDSCVLGTGIVHCRMHNLKKELVYEQVKAYELIFDWNSAMNEKLSSFHILKFINRYDLIAEYPDFEREILKTPVQNDLLTTAIVNTNTIMVCYSYDFYAQRQSVCVSNAVLVDDEWNYKDIYGDPLLPLAIMRYEHDDRGFFGIGASEKLKAVQNELNKLVQTAQMASHLGAIPKVWVPRGADVTKSALDNSMGGICYYSGPTPPTSMPMMTIPVDLFTQIDSFYRRGFEIIGVSQLSAGSQKPIGIDSGKGLETMYQIESDRFQMLGQEYENLYIQLNDITLAFYEQTAEMSHKALVQTYFKEKEGEVIRFEDINIRRDQCYLKAFPISALPQTPAGQFDEVYKRLQAGFITVQQGQKLLRLPDTEMFTDLETAELDYVSKQMSNMVRGEPEEPIAFQNPEMALGEARKHFFHYSNAGLAEENLNLIAAYIQSCQRLINNQVMEAQANAIQQQSQLLAASAQQSAGNNASASGAGAAQPASPVGGGTIPQAA